MEEGHDFKPRACSRWECNYQAAFEEDTKSIASVDFASRLPSQMQDAAEFNIAQCTKLLSSQSHLSVAESGLESPAPLDLNSRLMVIRGMIDGSNNFLQILQRRFHFGVSTGAVCNGCLSEQILKE